MRKQFTDLTKEDLWKLRGEIVLNSLFTKDYKNSFGFAPKSLQGFFDGYLDYLYDLAKEDGHTDKEINGVVQGYDNADNLFDYYWSGEDYSWVKYEPEWTAEEMAEYEKYWNGIN